mmetsp:Transcript_99660/g.278415  ORF Transcript_99660/g.278415 Transcript_99660/m.278415 type:complete len:219 (+) Transcript_99660:85-741(+)
MLVVLHPDAVVDPRAVVVHLQDAHATHSTVMASIRLVLRTPLAVPAVARALGLLKAGHGRAVALRILGHVLPGGVLLPVRDAPRVHQDARDVAPGEQGRNDIEDRGLYCRAVSTVRVAQPGHCMVEHINKVQAEDVAHHKRNGQKFRLLPEAALFSRIGRCRRHDGTRICRSAAALRQRRVQYLLPDRSAPAPAAGRLPPPRRRVPSHVFSASYTQAG